MWAAQFFSFEEPNRWMTSGGLGTMGYGLPAAIGVQMAHPEALVIDIAGEASVLMTMQEMSDGDAVQPAGQDLHPEQRIHGHGAPVAGVAAWRALFGELLRCAARFREARRGLSAAVGIRCDDPAELDDAIMRDDRHAERPVIFDCLRRQSRKLLPDDPFGASRTTR